jgi:hypothetical protein
MADLVARSLELPADVDFSGVEVDIWPGEPERFATAQTKDEHQHIGRRQGIMVAPSGFEKGTGLLNEPPLPLWLPGIGQPHNRSNVAGKQLFGHGVGERGAEHITDVLDSPVGKRLWQHASTAQQWRRRRRCTTPGIASWADCVDALIATLFANAAPYLLFALGEQHVASSTAGMLNARPDTAVLIRYG